MVTHYIHNPTVKLDVHTNTTRTYTQGFRYTDSCCILAATLSQRVQESDNYSTLLLEYLARIGIKPRHLPPATSGDVHGRPRSALPSHPNYSLGSFVNSLLTENTNTFLPSRPVNCGGMARPPTKEMLVANRS